MPTHTTSSGRPCRRSGRPARLAGALALVFAAPAAFAAAGTCSTPTDLPLEPRAAVARALCDSPELRAVQARVTRAGASRDEAAAASAVSTQLGVSGLATQDLGGGLARSDSRVLWPSIGVSRTLWDQGRTAQAVAQGDLQIQAERTAAEARARSLADETLTRYFELLSALVRLDAARLSAEVSRNSLLLVDARLKAGLATRVDRLSAESALAESVRQVREIEADSQRLEGQLARRLGLPVQIGSIRLPVGLLAGRDPAIRLVDEPPAVDIAIARAEAADPTLAELRLRLDAARAAVERARLGNAWNVQASLSTGPRAQGGSALAGTALRWHSEASLSASRTLGDGGAQDARLRQALADEDSARIAIEQQRLDLDQSSWQRWSRRVQAVDALQAREQAWRAAVAVAEARARQYEAGAGNLSDLLAAQADMAAKLSLHEAAQVERVAAEAALALVLGELDGLLAEATRPS
ncbi:TolC family protein [Leptothrix sp. BB-4]